jgi:hypothetical protein
MDREKLDWQKIISVARTQRTPFRPAPRKPVDFSRLFLVLGRNVLLIAAGLLLLAGYLGWRVKQELDSWVHTQATVVSSEVYSREARFYAGSKPSTQSTVYGFRCMTEFVIGGVPHFAQLDLGYQTGSEAGMRHWRNRYPAGSQIEIAYDPSNPERGRFAGEIGAAYATALLAARWGLWAVALSLGLLTISRKIKRPGPEDSAFNPDGPLPATR